MATFTKAVVVIMPPKYPTTFERSLHKHSLSDCLFKINENRLFKIHSYFYVKSRFKWIMNYGYLCHLFYDSIHNSYSGPIPQISKYSLHRQAVFTNERDLGLLSTVIPVSSHLLIHHVTSSHQHDDDDDDVETSRASTPSPTTYLNSLNPFNETLFERQTTLLNQTQEMHKEMRGGFKSFGKALKGVFSKKKK
ncbi:hypothetical protein Tco_0632400 [Tanacetum coccineum]